MQRPVITILILVSLFLALPVYAQVQNMTITPVLSLLLFAGKDCNGVKDGTAYLDDCGICVGGNTGKISSLLVTCVTSAGGLIWMDRNLGASQVATSLTDLAAYGDLYQWGRFTDGHEKRTSTTTSALSTTDVPEHGSFILASSSPYDWITPQNDILWKGVSSINNPCPQGFRLPTRAEWEIERASWSSNDDAGAFTSPLKLAATGYRNYSSGTVENAGSVGYYWSSTVDGSIALDLHFTSSYAYMSSYYYRAYGFTVRCLKD